MANTSTNNAKAALLQGLPPSPGIVEGTSSAPGKDTTPEAQASATNQSNAASKRAPTAAAPAPASKKADKGDKDPAFGESGAFNINDKWSTSMRYEGKIVDGQVSELSVKFTNGRKQVAAVNLTSRDTAVEVLGERNVANIESGLGKDKESMPAGVTKGKLQAEDLAFKKSYTLDRKPENLIEQDTSRNAQKDNDAEVRQWVAGRREQLRQQRLQNEKGGEAKEAHAGESHTSPGRQAAAGDKAQPGRDDAAAQKPNLEKEPVLGAAGKDDQSKAVPEHVTKRFLQAEDKYYFPDKTFAFEDRGAKLATNTENQEVVRSLIAIAQARGWDNITVRGSEEFRRSAWLEAATQGIEVRGYKPTAVEKAHLASIMEKQGEREADLPNSVSKGRDRNADQTQAITPAPTQTTAQAKEGQEATQTAAQAAKEASLKSRPGATVGKLIDHGEAHYQNDPKKEKSYFVTVETERGQKTLWGVDLQRAVAESNVQIGENVSVEHQGKKPVTAKEKVYDKAGNVTGERDVETHRNKWLVGSVDKAQAFATGDRAEAVAKHPDLAPAYGAVAAARKVAEQAWPGNKQEQDRFVSATVQVLTDKIAAGEEVPAPKIRETITKEQKAPAQDKSKQAGKELERER